MKARPLERNGKSSKNVIIETTRKRHRGVFRLCPTAIIGARSAEETICVVFLSLLLFVVLISLLAVFMCVFVFVCLFVRVVFIKFVFFPLPVIKHIIYICIYIFSSVAMATLTYKPTSLFCFYAVALFGVFISSSVTHTIPLPPDSTTVRSLDFDHLRQHPQGPDRQSRNFQRRI